MIYTSYFANWRNFPKDKIQVSISRFKPKHVQCKDYKDLSPAEDILNMYRSGSITEDEYTSMFQKQLDELDLRVISKDLENCILLCYEKKGDFCHRSIVKQWLNQNGIPCSEL